LGGYGRAPAASAIHDDGRFFGLDQFRRRRRGYLVVREEDRSLDASRGEFFRGSDVEEYGRTVPGENLARRRGRDASVLNLRRFSRDWDESQRGSHDKYGLFHALPPYLQYIVSGSLKK